MPLQAHVGEALELCVAVVEYETPYKRPKVVRTTAAAAAAIVAVLPCLDFLAPGSLLFMVVQTRKRGESTRVVRH